MEPEGVSILMPSAYFDVSHRLMQHRRVLQLAAINSRRRLFHVLLRFAEGWHVFSWSTFVRVMALSTPFHSFSWKREDNVVFLQGFLSSDLLLMRSTRGTRRGLESALTSGHTSSGSFSVIRSVVAKAPRQHRFPCSVERCVGLVPDSRTR